MKYKGFFVKITSDNNLMRESKDKKNVKCEGFIIEVFSDEAKKYEIDLFSAAVGFEIRNNSMEEVEQFSKDYIDCEEKEYQKIIDEFGMK